MSQFDVYVNPTPAARAGFPYLVDLQSAQLRDLPTRLVMPLQRLARPPAGMPRRLVRTVTIGGEALYLAAHQCAAMPARLLRNPIANLAAGRASVLDAVDAVFSGV
jgi:toxin CcdB